MKRYLQYILEQHRQSETDCTKILSALLSLYTERRSCLSVLFKPAHLVFANHLLALTQKDGSRVASTPENRLKNIVLELNNYQQIVKSNDELARLLSGFFCVYYRYGCLIKNKNIQLTLYDYHVNQIGKQVDQIILQLKTTTYQDEKILLASKRIIPFLSDQQGYQLAVTLMMAVRSSDLSSYSNHYEDLFLWMKTFSADYKEKLIQDIFSRVKKGEWWKRGVALEVLSRLTNVIPAHFYEKIILQVISILKNNSDHWTLKWDACNSLVVFYDFADFTLKIAVIDNLLTALSATGFRVNESAYNALCNLNYASIPEDLKLKVITSLLPGLHSFACNGKRMLTFVPVVKLIEMMSQDQRKILLESAVKIMIGCYSRESKDAACDALGLLVVHLSQVECQFAVEYVNNLLNDRNYLGDTFHLRELAEKLNVKLNSYSHRQAILLAPENNVSEEVGAHFISEQKLSVDASFFHRYGGYEINKPLTQADRIFLMNYILFDRPYEISDGLIDKILTGCSQESIARIVDSLLLKIKELDRVSLREEDYYVLGKMYHQIPKTLKPCLIEKARQLCDELAGDIFVSPLVRDLIGLDRFVPPERRLGVLDYMLRCLKKGCGFVLTKKIFQGLWQWKESMPEKFPFRIIDALAEMLVSADSFAAVEIKQQLQLWIVELSYPEQVTLLTQLTHRQDEKSMEIVSECLCRVIQSQDLLVREAELPESIAICIAQYEAGM